MPRHLPQNSRYLYHNITNDNSAATNDDDDVAMTAIFQNGVIYVFCRQYFVLLCPYGVVVNVLCVVFRAREKEIATFRYFFVFD